VWSELRKRSLIVLATFLILSFFVFLFPSVENSISIRIYKIITSNVLPTNVKIISPNPTSALKIGLTMSFLIGFVLNLPILIYNFVKFFFPALYFHERKILIKYSLWFFPFFLFGLIFCYFIFLPLTFKLLFAYLSYLEIIPLLDLGFLFDFILLSLFVFGFIFLTPLIMRFLTKLNLVKRESWEKALPFVILGAAIVGAIITPDGTGITQLIFAGAFVLLYLIGILISPKVIKSKG
jgi:sec-independent protein translocase protein TatC